MGWCAREGEIGLKVWCGEGYWGKKTVGGCVGSGGRETRIGDGCLGAFCCGRRGGKLN